MSKILIVDDEQSMRDFLAIMLTKEGHEIITAESGMSALKAIHTDIFDLVISDIKMPGMSGLELLQAVKELSSATIVIMITAFAAAETAVEAMKLGASDYIIKPFKIDELKLIIKDSLEKRDLQKENVLLKREIESKSGFNNFIGKSVPMQKIFTLIRQVADTTSTVLITGESGTGKELVAQAIHFNSARRKGPFITINCGALPETLLESELFGYMKGAFTGAATNKQGLFESAHGGSIFLDEISATSSSLQIKLLRVLQEREFMRVGGTSTIHVDTRIIAATNRELAFEVSKGTFREDLYYRLNVIPIRLPALRERKDDIPLLIDHFLKKYAVPGKEPKKITPDALELCLNYQWAGNVRELENFVERIAILTPHELIYIADIPDSLKTPHVNGDLLSTEIPENGLDLEFILENIEKTFLAKALDKANGVKTDAAKFLKLSFRSFRHRLQKYDFK
jgi:two-component system, NtrC family, response regulator PilR